MTIPVGILGATGMVGQKFIELLQDHPLFSIAALVASDRSVNKTYAEAAEWRMKTPLPQSVANMKVLPAIPNLSCQVVFSGLDSSVASEIEKAFASSGYLVISNCSAHRMDSFVPLLIPEVNSDHLALAHHQNYGKGMIVTNPNCSVVGIAMALKPLVDRFGLSAFHAVTLQALSGAGSACLDMRDNIIPYITDEEEKIETETLKIFGKLSGGAIDLAKIDISAQCTRVPVVDGHTACLSVKLKKEATKQELIEAWNTYRGEPQKLQLGSAPSQPLRYFSEVDAPQPKVHRDLERGMAVSIGRLRQCNTHDWKFTLLSHNTIRGAAGGAILNAELMLEKGFIAK